MKISRIHSLLLILFAVGCTSDYVSKVSHKFQTKEEFLDYLMEGYLNSNEPLYRIDGNGGRLEKLYKSLGLSECFNGIYTVNKGELLIFNKYGKNRDPNEFYTLVLSANAPPKLIRSWEDLWNGQCRVFHYSDKDGLQCLDKERFRRTDHSSSMGCRLYKHDYLKFYNGHVIKGNIATKTDVDRRFVCYMTINDKQDTEKKENEKSEPIYIISVDNPKMKVQSRLESFPDSMAISNNRLYLGTITPRKALPLLHFEVFDIITENELKYIKDYYVDVPWGFAVPLAYMFDYDFQTHSQKIVVYRDFPFFNNIYLYSYDDNCFKKIPDGIYRFINPAILKNSVQYVDLEKVNALVTESVKKSERP